MEKPVCLKPVFQWPVTVPKVPTTELLQASEMYTELGFKCQVLLLLYYLENKSTTPGCRKEDRSILISTAA
jgi:hypothetical protein